jgi:hypothetical protein
MDIRSDRRRVRRGWIYSSLNDPIREFTSNKKSCFPGRESSLVARTETDHDLMSGLIAMQSELIEMSRFVDACTLWGSRIENSLATILVEQG